MTSLKYLASKNSSLENFEKEKTGKENLKCLANENSSLENFDNEKDKEGKPEMSSKRKQ